MEIYSALWTFPAILLAAILIAWGAECGQFFVSQGLALAILAWLQTLPEFAVEAVIARDAAIDPSKIHLISANFTGSLRLLVGVGWPLVYFTMVGFNWRKNKSSRPKLLSIKLEDEHAVEVLALLLPLFYFLIIYLKGTLNLIDGFILLIFYLVYLYILRKLPPQDEEKIEELGVGMRDPDEPGRGDGDKQRAAGEPMHTPKQPPVALDQYVQHHRSRRQHDADQALG